MTDDPTTPAAALTAELDAAWRELEADALASDGPIRDADVKTAIKRNRGRIEAAARPVEARVEALEQEVRVWKGHHDTQVRRKQATHAHARRLTAALRSIREHLSRVADLRDGDREVRAALAITLAALSGDVDAVADAALAPDPATTPVECQHQDNGGALCFASERYHAAYPSRFDHDFTPTPPAPAGRGERCGFIYPGNGSTTCDRPEDDKRHAPPFAPWGRFHHPFERPTRCAAHGQDHSRGCPASDTYPLDPGEVTA